METKVELTVENLITAIKSLNLNYTINSLSDWNVNRYDVITKYLIEYFFENSEIKKEVKSDFNPMKSGFCYINENHKEKELDNLIEVSFNHLYSNLIIKLYKQNEIFFNSVEFAYFYEFLLINYDSIKSSPNINEKTLIIFRGIVNAFFGYSIGVFGRKSYYHFFGNSSLITTYTYPIYDKLTEKYSDNIVYIDTDSFYFKNINIDDINDFLSDYDLPYIITTDISALFLNKKRYIEDINGEIKIHGLYSDKQKKYCKNNVNDYIEKRKFIHRINKITKLKNNMKNLVVS